MAGHAERKQRALARVHTTFERPAVYLTHAAGLPVTVNVRIHRKQVIENLDGFTDAAAMLNLTDRIIFNQCEVAKVLHNAYVIYKPPGRPVEGYLTGPSKPEREGYIWVEVSPLSEDDLSAFVAQIDTSDPVWEGILI